MGYRFLYSFRRRAPCVLKNGNWNMQDILPAQSPLYESRMRLIAKQAQRSMLIIHPDTLYFTKNLRRMSPMTSLIYQVTQRLHTRPCVL
jgi:hypothetical protein